MVPQRIDRRTVLAALGTVGVGSVAGCSESGDGGDPTEAGTTAATTQGTTATTAQGPTTEETTAEEGDEDTIYVATDGADGAAGTVDEPVASIAEAVDRAGPGETVQVAPGEYREALEIGEGGTSDAPLEITGPPDAVLRRPADAPAVMLVGGDHVHLTGLTIDGLADPDRPEDPSAYGNGPLVLYTAKSFDEFNEGAVVAPHAIGNSGRQLVKLRMAADAEVGPFEVTGRAGAKWLYSDENNHNGEIVYVGTSPNTIAGVDGWTEWDRTHDVHVHHVDNAAGHPHSQFVDVKPGAHDVTIEYCTDGGGSQHDEDWTVRDVALRGHACTLRWCRLQEGEGEGVGVGSNVAVEAENEVQERAGDGNEIYGNEILGFGGQALSFPQSSLGPGQGPDDQAVVCGNRVDPPTDGDPEATCGTDVPTGDGLGHVGGDSPWAGESLPTVARPEFEFEASIETETVTVGESVTVAVTVSNTGGGDGTLPLVLRSGGTEIARDEVTVAAGETVDTALEAPGAPTPGTRTLTLNGREIGEVTVEES